MYCDCYELYCLIFKGFITVKRLSNFIVIFGVFDYCFTNVFLPMVVGLFSSNGPIHAAFKNLSRVDYRSSCINVHHGLLSEIY